MGGLGTCVQCIENVVLQRTQNMQTMQNKRDIRTHL